MKKALILICIAAFTLYSQTSYAQYNFFNGNDWIKINDSNMSVADKKRIKTMLLKSVYEASFFSGNPMIEIPNYDEIKLKEYIEIIDNFFSKPENKIIPLHFTLKIADMIKNGEDNDAIARYRLVVLTKLKQKGLLK